MFILFLPYIFSLVATFIVFGEVLSSGSAHIMLSLLSYSILFAAFILSFIMSYQIKQLRNHNVSVISSFPALETNERVLFGTIYLGFIALSIAIVNGFMVTENLFAQHLVHKTVFAIIAWVIILVLSSFRVFVGLSDKRAIYAVQVAFTLLIVGYFGTKIALMLTNN